MSVRRENDPMFDGGPDPTELQEKVWDILDDAGAPESLLEAVDKLIFEFEIAAQRDRGDPIDGMVWLDEDILDLLLNEAREEGRQEGRDILAPILDAFECEAWNDAISAACERGRQFIGPAK